MEKTKETKETKPVSFRLPTDVFDTLQDKGQEMDLSAHEVASKIVQENYQAPIEGEGVKETVIHSKHIILPPCSKQVFHFNMNELRSLHFSFSGKDCLPHYILTMRIGIDEHRGLKRIGKDLWEHTVETFKVYNPNE